MSLLWAKRGWLTPGSQFLRAVERLGATDVWDFVDNSYMRAGVVTTNAGLTVTRASSGYAETSDGRLVSFASGVARRTDKGLLIEGARTNLLLRSQEFDDAAWFQASATPTENAAFAPDGTLTANSIVKSNNFGNVRQQVAITANATFTFSVYVKAGTATNGSIGVFENSLGTLLSRASVNLSTGAVANDVGTTNAQSVGNGWWRVSTTVTTTTASNVAAALYPSVASDNNAGTTLFWGAQLEAGDFASSYIKTEGSTGTRAADQVGTTINGYAYPMSVFAEWIKVFEAAENFPRVFGVGPILNGFSIFHRNSTNRIAVVMLTSGAGQADLGTRTGALNTIQRVAARAQTDNMAISVNGLAAETDTLATMPAAPTYITVGDTDTGDGRYLSGYVRKLALFSAALTNAQLQGLST